MKVPVFSKRFKFPISRDPPEGGTNGIWFRILPLVPLGFPISRDPPEGGTFPPGAWTAALRSANFQFLGIPPKGEPHLCWQFVLDEARYFQFLGIPPKGELLDAGAPKGRVLEISNF